MKGDAGPAGARGLPGPVVKGQIGFTGIAGDIGTGATVVDNGDGTYTVTGANGNIILSDGETPTLTDNLNGTFTISTATESILISNGLSPVFGTDYRDGFTGNLVSFVYANVTTGSAAPTITSGTGTYNGTTETMPIDPTGTLWTDDPFYSAGFTTYMSKNQYVHNGGTDWSLRSNTWSAPVIFLEPVVQSATVLTSFIFKRFAGLVAPTTPLNGTYASPLPNPIDGWSDGIPSGTDNVWMSKAVFTSDGVNETDWTVPNMIGAAGQGTRLLFAPDAAGTGGWHTPPLSSDEWMITSTLGADGLWVDDTSNPIKIKGEMGIEVVTSFVAYAFKRSVTSIDGEIPTGGTFASPAPVDGVVAGWRTTIPDGTARIYVSTRTFISVGDNSVWTAAVSFSSDGLLRLLTDSYFFSYSDPTTLIAPSTITITAVRQNVENDLVWTTDPVLMVMDPLEVDPENPVLPEVVFGAAESDPEGPLFSNQLIITQAIFEDDQVMPAGMLKIIGTAGAQVDEITLLKTVSGYTPVKGIDYLDGTTGTYRSSIYISAPDIVVDGAGDPILVEDPPASGTFVTQPFVPITPIGGSFNGTVEDLTVEYPVPNGVDTFPSDLDPDFAGWTDDPIAPLPGEFVWVASKLYTSSIDIVEWLAAVTAGTFVGATEYIIVTTGTTDFTLIGAADSVVGTVFTATGVGTGTGTASPKSLTYQDTVWDASGVLNDGSFSTPVKYSYIPTLGLDYANGDIFISYIFRTMDAGTTAPQPDLTGSYDGTTETIPTDWTDNPETPLGDQVVWVSTYTYRKDAEGAWTVPEGLVTDDPLLTWSAPSKFTVEATLTGNLTNGLHSVQTDADGTNGTYNAAGGGTFLVRMGSADVVADTTFSAGTPTGGLTFTLDTATGVYAPTGLTDNVGTLPITATHTSGQTVTLVYTITKTLAGLAGSNGTSTRLDVAYGTTNVGGSVAYPSGLLSSTYLPASSSGKTYMGTNLISWLSHLAEPAVSTTAGDYEWTQLTGVDGDNGLSSRIDFAYSDSDNGVGNLRLASGKLSTTYVPATAITSSEWMGTNVVTWTQGTTEPVVSATVTDYEWMQFKGPQGATGGTGDTGNDGANGTATRFDVAYGTTNAGGVVNYPSGLLSTTYNPASSTGKDYIGTNLVTWLAHLAETAVSSTASEYEWTQLTGTDGGDGNNGISSRVDFAYSDTDNGVGNRQLATGLLSSTYTPASPATTNNFMGTNVVTWVQGATEPAVSSTNADYEWAQFQGPQGATGGTGDTGNDGATGTATRFDAAYGTTSAGGTVNFPSGLLSTTYTPASSTGKTFIGTNLVTWLANATETAVSTVNGEYEWTQLTGDAGGDGSNGISSRVDFAYSDSDNGVGNRQLPTGKLSTTYTSATPVATNFYMGTNVVTWTQGNTEPAVSSTNTDYEWAQYRGLDGDDGLIGGLGPRGPGWFYKTIATAAINPDSYDDAVNDAGALPVVVGDVATIINTGTNPDTTTTLVCTVAGGTNTWGPFTQKIDGNLLVTGTVAAGAIVSNSLTTTQIKTDYLLADAIMANDVELSGSLKMLGARPVTLDANSDIPLLITEGSKTLLGITSTTAEFGGTLTGLEIIDKMSLFHPDVLAQLVSSPIGSTSTGGTSNWFPGSIVVTSGVETTQSVSIATTSSYNDQQVTVSWVFTDGESFATSLPSGAFVDNSPASRPIWTAQVYKDGVGVGSPVSVTGTYWRIGNGGSEPYEYSFEITNQGSYIDNSANHSTVIPDYTMRFVRVSGAYTGSPLFVSGSVSQPTETTGGGGGSSYVLTKANIETTLTGEIASHTHAGAAADTPVTSTSLGSGVNLDTLAQAEDAGFYHQVSNAQAAAGTNWPTGTAGSLLVQKSANSGGYGTTQLYIGYVAAGMWFRGAYGSANAGWKQVSTVGHTHTFASLTSKPTTLSGYGITDGGVGDAILAGTQTFTGTNTFNQEIRVQGGIDTNTSTDVVIRRAGVLKGTFNSTGLAVSGTMAATTVTGANVTSGSNPGHTHTAYARGDTLSPSGTYYQVRGTNNSNTYICTPSAGLLPYQAGNASTVGTSSWKFNTMYATTFHGALSGNATTATTATNANNVYVSNYDTGDTAMVVLLANSGGNANRAVVEDSNFLYNSTTNTLSCTNFAGKATTCATADTANLIKVNDYAGTTHMRILGSHQTGGSDNVYSSAAMFMEHDFGRIHAVTFNTTSDGTLKNVTGVYNKNTARDITAKVYDWKDGKSSNQIGYIAQEVVPIIPEAAILNDETGLYSVNYTMVHTAKIAELEAIVEKQSEQIAKLMTMVNALTENK